MVADSLSETSKGLLILVEELDAARWRASVDDGDVPWERLRCALWL